MAWVWNGMAVWAKKARPMIPVKKRHRYTGMVDANAPKRTRSMYQIVLSMVSPQMDPKNYSKINRATDVL